MSEPQPLGLFGRNRYHLLEPRSEEVLNAAYHEALTCPAGCIVMDDLYRLVGFSRLPDERSLGQHDLWLYILGRLQAHATRRTPHDGGEDTYGR